MKSLILSNPITVITVYKGKNIDNFKFIKLSLHEGKKLLPCFLIYSIKKCCKLQKVCY